MTVEPVFLGVANEEAVGPAGLVGAAQSGKGLGSDLVHGVGLVKAQERLGTVAEGGFRVAQGQLDRGQQELAIAGE